MGLALALPAVQTGCVEDITVPDEAPPTLLAIGQPQTVELRFLRLDVKNYEQVLTQTDLQARQPQTLEDVWLLDFADGLGQQVLQHCRPATKRSRQAACRRSKHASPAQHDG
ncbi:hypothetical protein [Nannocystis sp.]|uniref:hypothetical protein n=1 Tax=Nannocystis sp. TaxID=1962667 RepID=UPI0025E05C0E|nr:hypothetical protein [Nannocystis sp.]MBK7825944.1 hypothetical protein [Nannocystis sp.]